MRLPFSPGVGHRCDSILDYSQGGPDLSLGNGMRGDESRVAGTVC